VVSWSAKGKNKERKREREREVRRDGEEVERYIVYAFRLHSSTYNSVVYFYHLFRLHQWPAYIDRENSFTYLDTNKYLIIL
jgi:hypothetical protein